MPKEQAILVGVLLPGERRITRERSLDELQQLARTAGVEVCGVYIQHRERIDPRTFIGRGLAKELGEKCKRMGGVGLLIFDHDLSGGQVRNLEEVAGAKVLDRTEVILDIFACHARTREAKLQVELAQLNYRLSRLRGRGILLSRLGGGIGTRGPGETKLEIDRRRIKDRISSLRRETRLIRRRRRLQRMSRRGLTQISIIGYTNAGKSSLMNVLTSAKAQVGNGLFITLDPRTRRLILPGDTRVLLTDTVGFIRNLPHHLVLAFSATLEEVQEADGFCHVVDVSEEDPEERMETVWGVLEELGVSTTPSITVFNKIDKVDQGTVQRLLRRFPQSVAISCTQGTGVPKLIKALSEFPPVKARSLQRGLSSQGAIF